MLDLTGRNQPQQKTQRMMFQGPDGCRKKSTANMRSTFSPHHTRGNTQKKNPASRS